MPRVVLQQRAERFGRERTRLDTLLRQALEDRRVLEQLVHGGVHLLDRRLRHCRPARAGRSRNRTRSPAAALGDGRQLGHESRALRAAHAEHLEARVLARAARRCRGITACARPTSTSLIASLVALNGMCTISTPARLAKYAIERCVALPLPARGEIELAGIGLQQGNEFRADFTAARRRHQHVVDVADVRHGREVLERVVRQLGVDVAGDGVARRREQQRRAVGGGFATEALPMVPPAPGGSRPSRCDRASRRIRR